MEGIERVRTIKENVCGQGENFFSIYFDSGDISADFMKNSLRSLVSDISLGTVRFKKKSTETQLICQPKTVGLQYVSDVDVDMGHAWLLGIRRKLYAWSWFYPENDLIIRYDLSTPELKKVSIETNVEQAVGFFSKIREIKFLVLKKTMVVNFQEVKVDPSGYQLLVSYTMEEING